MSNGKETVVDKVAAQNIRLLLERQKSGKALTRAQLQQVENYFSGQDNKTTTWAKSMQELATMFGVTRPAIKLWLKKGAPAANASGFYPLDAWHKWVVRNGKSQTLGQVSEKDRLIARQIHLKNQKLELEVQRARGQLMHVEEVRSKLFLTFDTCRRTQMHMVASLAPRLAGMSRCEIKAEMTSALNDSYSAIRRWADSMSLSEVDSSDVRSATT